MKIYCIILLSMASLSCFSQNNINYWQQHASYKMSINMDVEKHQYKGKQTLVYTNNSPDTLHKVYYHLYFNAFQPGSEMDMRSRTIKDPDPRVGERIFKLQPNEIGYINVNTLKQDGKLVNISTENTILTVELDKPILPGKSTTLQMDFSAQVPKQIRRSGRDNTEGISYSMTQWYPKMAEYDFEGWHAHPYIGREFHSVWGDYDVKITIHKDYILGGTGYLQNPNEVGYGYEDNGVKVKRRGKTLTWHFIAPKVHDFAWAADPDYIHDKFITDNGTTLHFLYQDDDNIKDNWKKLQPKTAQLLDYFNTHIGEYPYQQYSVIQGGDGGMEYPMCTLITGERTFRSLFGVTAHELAHSWFQHLLATNEAQHEWMDEGFTTYISTLAEDEILEENKTFPLQRSYKGYLQLANSGKEQPQSTHADRYAMNALYGISSYSKGSVFLNQLGYIVGENNLQQIIKNYYDTWKFKHPTPNDFIRVAEKTTGAELSWYLTDWTTTTNTIDYAIKDVKSIDSSTEVVLERIGLMPMPIEVQVKYQDNTSNTYYIPLQMMRWEKPNIPNVQKDWPWAMPTYSMMLPTKSNRILEIEIDPSQKMADVNRDNNVYKK